MATFKKNTQGKISPLGTFINNVTHIWLLFDSLPPLLFNNRCLIYNFIHSVTKVTTPYWRDVIYECPLIVHIFFFFSYALYPDIRPLELNSRDSKQSKFDRRFRSYSDFNDEIVSTISISI